LLSVVGFAATVKATSVLASTADAGVDLLSTAFTVGVIGGVTMSEKDELFEAGVADDLIVKDFDM